MLDKIFPKERNFFGVLDQMSECLSESILELLSCINKPEVSFNSLARIREIELKSEKISRESICYLHDSFVTPFDRHHIFYLFTHLCEVCTLSKLVIEKLIAYKIVTLPLEVKELGINAGELCKIQKQIVGQLRKINKPTEALQLCLKSTKISSNSDSILFNCFNHYYDMESDVKKIMKLQEVTRDISMIINKFKEISFLVEEIILEYA